MASKDHTHNLSATTLLLVAFIVLKLCKVINWSWWWVLSPAWIPAAIALIFFVIYLTFKKEEKEEGVSRKSKWQERLEKHQKERRE